MIAVKKSLDAQKHFTQRAKQHLFPLTPYLDSLSATGDPNLPGWCILEGGKPILVTMWLAPRHGIIRRVG
jgi:hypothetical protein